MKKLVLLFATLVFSFSQNAKAQISFDPAVTNIQASPTTTCMDSTETVIVTVTNFGTATLDLSINPIVIRLRVQSPTGLNIYTDTLNAGFLQAFSANNIFAIFNPINMYTGGTYAMNTDTLSLIGSTNSNYVNDSLFTAVVITNSRPKNVDYSLCLGDSILTGQGLGIINCPTAYVQDSVLIPFTLSFAGNLPGNPTQCSALGAGIFASGSLPTLPQGTNILSGALSASNLALAPPTFNGNPSLTRLSLYQGTLPTTAANIFHNGVQGSISYTNPGTFSYLSSPPATDLNSMYTNGAPNSPTVNIGHWSTNRCAAPSILVNSNGTTTVYLKLIYEYIPTGISWYEQPSGGLPISNASVFNPLQTANSIITNSNTAGSYTFYGACAVDTNCRVAVDLNISQLQFANIFTTDVSCNGAANGSIQFSSIGGVAPFTYQILSPFIFSNSTGFFSGLQSSTYILKISDATGCATKDSAITITEPPLLQLSANTTNVLCKGDSTGSVSISKTGGTGFTVYTISPSYGNTQQFPNGTFLNLPIGTYTTTGTDVNGCTANQTFTIAEPATKIQITNVTTTPPSCNPGNDGTVTIVTSGGTTPHQYAKGPTFIFQASNVFSGLAGGGILFRVADANGCYFDTTIIVMTPPPPSWTSVTSTNVICFGEANGTITAIASSALAPITYSLTPNIGTQTSSGTFINLPAGAYAVSASDVNNCSVSSAINVGSPAAIQINATTTNVLCKGDSSGSVVLTSSGGTGSLTFVLMSPPTGSIQIPSGTFHNLPAGTYTATGTDVNGCTRSTTFTIVQPATKIQITNVTSTVPTCVPGCDATMFVSASGGTGSLIYYNTSSSQVSNVFTNQCAGNYTISVLDANGCSASSTHTIQAPGAPSWTSVTYTNVLCFGVSSGSITGIATVGTHPSLAYSLVPPITQSPTGHFSNLPTGNYIIIASDGNNCSIQTTVSITQPSQLTIDTLAVTLPNCATNNNGSISLNVTGGTAGYIFNLLPNNAPNTTGNYTNLSAGIYTASVTDVNNCSATKVINLVPGSNIVITNTSYTAPTCAGDSNGTISISAVGNGVVSYSISPNLGSSNGNGLFTNLPSATYTITMNDSDNCALIKELFLPDGGITFQNAITIHTNCIDASSKIVVSAFSENGPISYSISPMFNAPTTSGVFTNLPNGTYTIIGTDANACTNYTIVTVNFPSGPQITNIQTTNVLCQGDSNGTIQFSAIGGTPPYNFSIPPPLLFPPWNNVPAGTYTFNVTDANNCLASATVVIAEPAPLILNATVSNTSCSQSADGQLVLNATGGTGLHIYILNGPTPSPPTPSGVYNNLMSGAYVASVLDANGCQRTSTVIILSDSIELRVSGRVNESCAPGKDGLIAVYGFPTSTNYLYSIDSANWQKSGEFKNLVYGDYQTFLLDTSNGCTANRKDSIRYNNNIPLNETLVTHEKCYKATDGSILAPNKNYTYTLIPTAGTQSEVGFIKNIPPGIYTFIAENANGCKGEKVVVIEAADSLWLSSLETGTSNVHCYGSVQIKLIGGAGNFGYSLQPNSGKEIAPGYYDGLCWGEYFVTGKDDRGCTITKKISILEDPNAPENMFTHFIVYPNPANDVIWFKSNYLFKYEVTLLTIYGQVIKVQNMYDKLSSISVSDVTPGMYIIRFKSDVNVFERKVLISR